MEHLVNFGHMEERLTMSNLLWSKARVQLWWLSYLISLLQTSGPVSEGVEVALDPSELDLDTATMTARWALFRCWLV